MAKLLDLIWCDKSAIYQPRPFINNHSQRKRMAATTIVNSANSYTNKTTAFLHWFIPTPRRKTTARAAQHYRFRKFHFPLLKWWFFFVVRFPPSFGRRDVLNSL
jgi:hypothetical protein